MESARNCKQENITVTINEEIQIALRGIGVDEVTISRIPEMSEDELYSTARNAKADAYLLAYIGSWGRTLLDDDVLYYLKQWNAI